VCNSGRLDVPGLEYDEEACCRSRMDGCRVRNICVEASKDDQQEASIVDQQEASIVDQQEASIVDQQEASIVDQQEAGTGEYS
jgi:hypothetical protein